jgi:hypothetical protein
MFNLFIRVSNLLKYLTSVLLSNAMISSLRCIEEDKNHILFKDHQHLIPALMVTTHTNYFNVYNLYVCSAFISSILFSQITVIYL